MSVSQAHLTTLSNHWVVHQAPHLLGNLCWQSCCFWHQTVECCYLKARQGICNGIRGSRNVLEGHREIILYCKKEEIPNEGHDVRRRRSTLIPYLGYGFIVRYKYDPLASPQMSPSVSRRHNRKKFLEVDTLPSTARIPSSLEPVIAVRCAETYS